jgi:hypothetical protein
LQAAWADARARAVARQRIERDLSEVATAVAAAQATLTGQRQAWPSPWTGIGLAETAGAAEAEAALAVWQLVALPKATRESEAIVSRPSRPTWRPSMPMCSESSTASLRSSKAARLRQCRRQPRQRLLRGFERIQSLGQLLSYIEMTEPNGRRITIQRVFVASQTDGHLTLGSRATLYFDRITIAFSPGVKHLWGHRVVK